MKSNSDQSSPAHPRLLAVTRILWLVYTVSILVLHLASLPSYFERVSSGTVADITFELGLPSSMAYFTDRASIAGLSLGNWLIANTAASLLVVAVHTLIAGLIFWRLPRSWFALLSSFVIMYTGMSAMDNAFQASGLHELLGPGLLLLTMLGAVVWPLFPIWLYLFPDGRAVPQWTRWPVGIMMGVFMIFMIVGIFANSSLISQEAWQWIGELSEQVDLTLILVAPGLVLVLTSQIYRYWRVSGPIERQQTKWFLFGLSLFVLAIPLAQFLPFMVRLEAISGSISLMIIPITIAIALLRFHLWDLNLIVRKTTGYALLTSMLLLVYFASVVILQRLLSPITGESEVAVVLSTLLIAALFLPLRRRVQNAIDRRFFRQKYDAEKVIAEFAATVRDETDLDTLTSELLRVIQETMQPEFVNIVLFEKAPRIMSPAVLGEAEITRS